MALVGILGTILVASGALVLFDKKREKQDNTVREISNYDFHESTTEEINECRSYELIEINPGLIDMQDLIKKGRMYNSRYYCFPLYPETEISPTFDKGDFASKGEHHTYKCLLNIFKVEFTKIRPNWLKNPYTKRNLELDFFNEDLKLGVEYNGQQHYKISSKFHSSSKSHEDQIKRDAIKEELCYSNEVALIRIPWNIKQEYIQRFIYFKLIESIS